MAPEVSGPILKLEVGDNDRVPGRCDVSAQRGKDGSQGHAKRSNLPEPKVFQFRTLQNDLCSSFQRICEADPPSPIFKGDPGKNMNDDCPSIELVRPILLSDQATTMGASATFELVMESL